MVTEALHEHVAALVEALPDAGVRRVGIDGVDGAGKSVFAGVLARTLRGSGLGVIHASVDDFHNPRQIRYRQGRYSPDGYYEDSFDYDALRRELLDPLSPGGSGRFRRAVHDVRTDRRLDVHDERVAPPAVLVVDGVFLHRPELVGYWDLSVFLDIDFPTSVARLAERDGTSPDPQDPAMRRYIDGQRRYLRECRPAERASVVIGNRDYDAPVLLRSTRGVG